MQLNSLVSESRNPHSQNLDTLSTAQILSLINREDTNVPRAIVPCLPKIAMAVDTIVDRLQGGGRLVYLGAGTSGRLGILDAVECPPTFSVDPGLVMGVMAGGQQAMFQAVEGAEDDQSLAITDLQKLNFNPKDILVGIAASGRTPYVIAGLNYAKSLGAKTIALTSNLGSAIAKIADIEICPQVGPEVLTGSTRMKSGTAQKLVLNMLSTAAMIRTGKSYGNLMVDVKASNEKLQARARRILMQATHCDEASARQALIQCQQNVKLAILHLLTGVSPEQGRQALLQQQGFLRQAIEAIKQQDQNNTINE